MTDTDDQTPPTEFRRRSVGGDRGMLHALRDYLLNDYKILGFGDLLLINGGSPAGRAGLVAAVLSGLRLDDGERAIQHYRIVIPPTVDLAEATERFWDRFARAFEDLSGAPLDEQQRGWFENRAALLQIPDFNTASVIALITAQPEQTALLVTEAALYRDATVSPYVAPGAAGPLSSADIWVPHLLALGQAAASISETQSLYVALDTDELSPVQPELTKLLHAIERFGIMSGSSDEDRDTILARRVVQWDAWIEAGHIGLALADITALPESFADQKAFLRVQLLNKAGLTHQALAELRSDLLTGEHYLPDTRARLALIAWRAGAANLAHELLEPAIDELYGLEELQSALNTLDAIGSVDLAERVALRLEARFPETPTLARYRREQLLRARNYKGAATLFRAQDSARADFYERLATAFAHAGVPDYLALIETGVNLREQEAFRLAGAEDAILRGLIPHAFDLAAPQPAVAEFHERWESVLLDVLEQCFQRGTDRTDDHFRLDPAPGIPAQYPFGRGRGRRPRLSRAQDSVSRGAVACLAAGRPGAQLDR